MKNDDFEYMANILRQRSGLVITAEKTYLLESRLAPVARKWAAKTLGDLVLLAREKRDEALLRDITEAMTTNESFFFRDQKPFDQFRNKLLPQLLNSRANKKQIRIWSAAASSGQEAYSIAMICREEAARLHGWRIDIVGTDLSTEIIDKAKEGIYTQFEVQRGLPITMLVKYFDQTTSDKWQIKQDIRNMVRFQQANLLSDFSSLGTFDIIYCRNVLIYFDQPLKAKVLEAISNSIAKDGHLFLGGAETVIGISSKFKPLDGERGIYVLT